MPPKISCKSNQFLVSSWASEKYAESALCLSEKHYGKRVKEVLITAATGREPGPGKRLIVTTLFRAACLLRRFTEEYLLSGLVITWNGRCESGAMPSPWLCTCSQDAAHHSILYCFSSDLGERISAALVPEMSYSSPKQIILLCLAESLGTVRAVEWPLILFSSATCVYSSCIGHCGSHVYHHPWIY